MLLFLITREVAGPAAGWSAAAACACGVALLLRRESRPGDIAWARAVDWVLVPLPALLILYLSFNAGGFFPATKAFVALVLAIALALRIAVAPSPFAGFSRWSIAATAGLGLYAVWTLVSGSWSHTWGRAFLEFDQALVYALALALFAGAPRETARNQSMLWGVAGALVAVCTVALITRLFPDVWPIGPNLATDRLSYPLTYWNALGLMAAIAVVLCLHLACTSRGPRVGAAAASAAVPIAATTLYFTFSRGAVAAVAIGVVAYLVVARPYGVVGGLIATALPTVLAVKTAYDARLLASLNPTGPAAVAQGHHVGLIVALSAVAAAILRIATMPLDRSLFEIRKSVRIARPVAIAIAACAVVALGGVAVAAGAPQTVSRQYDKFVHQTPAPTTDLRQRFGQASSNNRIAQWRVGTAAYKREKLHGNGAGTYENIWTQRRPNLVTVVDAHSLYVESLAELGVVGFVLLLVAILAVLVGLLARTRGRSRSLYAAVFAAGLTWALHAGVDWDWEVPAATVAFFALGGACIARKAVRDRTLGPPLALRGVSAAIVIGVAVVPLIVALSEHRLTESADAAARGDCTRATERANASLSALSSRAEPRETIAFCEQARGRNDAAVKAIDAAVRRDPGNARYRYELALFRAAAGRDPRSALRSAKRLNPRDFRIPAVAAEFARARSTRWPAIAHRLIETTP